MKRIQSILLIGLFAYILSGCTYWTMSTSESPRVEASTETIEKNEYVYTDDLAAYKKVELHLNIDVSDVIIQKGDNSIFTLTQHANREKIFVVPTSTPSGDTLILSFDSPSQQMIFNSLNSDIVIELPESILYSIDSTVDVGKFNLSTDSLQFEALIASTDVGDITVALDSEQANLKNIELNSDVGKINLKLPQNASSLETIVLNSDVGDLSMAMSGDFPSIEQLQISGDTGKIKLSLDGVYKNAFSLDASSDIGEVKLDLAGQYADDTHVKCITSTGGVKLKIDENLKVKLIAKEDEFVSKIKFNNVAYTAENDYFFINNATSTLFNLTIEADSDVGNIEITH
ncbi:DUF4097 family beta strand repeat-containing protein [Fusibacter sp. 3D3]|uniref:DUF4097 family beta strand repeat-containing protein n=1 Tax=Fusibacter sp. 3D3 TaxID=1048380 RepID=UPI000853B889|nr:hypothetical protein [Fusibacter sp. 3D3]GAU78726.1 hypothetical protein F3D3_3361 [Fusibacter sp. 3D3]